MACPEIQVWCGYVQETGEMPDKIRHSQSVNSWKQCIFIGDNTFMTPAIQPAVFKLAKGKIKFVLGGYLCVSVQHENKTEK